MSDQEEKPEHRGRLQVQGEDMTDGELSKVWQQEEPLNATIAKLNLDELAQRCTKRQRRDRERGFIEAKRAIENHHKEGGISAIWTDSFPRSRRHKRLSSQRVDIEVLKGRAFT